MRPSCHLIWTLLCLSSSALASGAVPPARPDRLETPSLAPYLTAIPQSYLFSGLYNVKLTRKEMRIDHMATGSRCPLRQRACALSLSYSQPIGAQLFSSQVDVPLFSSEQMFSTWNTASMGDYVLHFSNVPLRSSYLQLVANARF